METNETQPVEAEYRVVRLDWLREQIAKLNRRAAKIGAASVVLTVLREETRKVDEAGLYTETVYVVRVAGETPRLAGWHLVAVLQHIEDGTIVAAVPGMAAEGELAAYRDAPAYCAHCRTTRRRTDTYLLRHTDGRLVQVGSSCLADFLGGADPKALAWAAEFWRMVREAAEDAEEWGTGGRAARSINLRGFLAVTATAIRTLGWMPRGKAREAGEIGTADKVLDAITTHDAEKCRRPWACTLHIHAETTDADYAEADAALAWARAIGDSDRAYNGTLSDYEHSITTLARGERLDPRHAGIAASIVSSYQRHMQRERERAAERAQAAASEHVGTVGQRLALTLTVLSSTNLESDWGLTVLYKLADSDGNRFSWFASNGGALIRRTVEVESGGVVGTIPVETAIEDGHTYTLKGTVKAHGEYRGVKETQLTRCKVLGEVEAATVKEGGAA